MKRLIKFTLLIFVVLIFSLISCQKSTDGIYNGLEINFPINKKAVYASAIYEQNEDSLSLLGLEIHSVIYSEKNLVNDTTYMKGISGTYGSYTFNSNAMHYYQGGNLTITLTDEWVLHQHSTNIGDYNMFLKVSAADTTALPTEYLAHFPVFPRILGTNQSYSIYRPGNHSGNDSWGYIGLLREFQTKDMVTFEDQYGKETGLYMNVNHIFNGFADTFFYKSVIDKHGIIASTISYTAFSVSSTDPDGIADSSIVYSVNRRIVDFQDENQVSDLKTYYEQIEAIGLKIVE